MYILSNLISSTKITEKCEPESLESFKTRLVDILKENNLNEEIREKVYRLAKGLRIDH